MALEMNDIMALKALGDDDKSRMTPYENFIMTEKTSRRPSNVGIAGLVLGTVGTAAAIGAWVFAPMYSSAKANQARYLAKQQYDGTLALINATQAGNQRQLDQLTSLLGAERNERIQGDVTLTNTVNDSVSGQQASTLTAQQAAELSAVNSVMQQTYSDFVTGRASLNPTPVSLYSAPQPCSCPASGCGCNG